MPIVTLTDITLRSLRTPGKQLTYIDNSLKGFGVRVNERGMSYVLTFGADRQRIKIADVGVVPLKSAREIILCSSVGFDIDGGRISERGGKEDSGAAPQLSASGCAARQRTPRSRNSRSVSTRLAVSTTGN